MRDWTTWEQARALATELPFATEDVYDALMTGASAYEVRTAARALRAGSVPRLFDQPRTLADVASAIRAAADPSPSRWQQAAQNALTRAIERHG